MEQNMEKKDKIKRIIAGVAFLIVLSLALTALSVYWLTHSGEREVLANDVTEKADTVYNVKSAAAEETTDENDDTIRVLIKNDSEYTYGALYVTGDKKCTVDGKRIKAGKAISAAKYLKNEAEGSEVRVEVNDGGMLYLCSKKGKKLTEGYEGDFILRKYGEGYVLINELPVETYLRYVLPSEMPPGFSYEALKAQAVCARTFAYMQMGSDSFAVYGADLDDSTSSQVYHASETYESTDSAIEDTKGKILTSGGETIECYYYSTSPGYSENLEVWNAKSPSYLVAENHTKEKTVDLTDSETFHNFISESVDSYDAESPFYRWTATLSSSLGMDEEYGRLKEMYVKSRSSSGYITGLTVVFENGSRTYDREDAIRFALGKYISKLKLSDGSVRTNLTALPSACFEVASQSDGTIILKGGGYGHGIGMSQYGADAMGDEGMSYKEILKYYYNNVEITEK
jgi:stage II sporulation protein D